ncbi:TPR-like protein [Agrocybe pediades]|nr:TPR-like protein [Agrocybe pediades]
MINDSVSTQATELKKRANALYCEKRFHDAEKLYTQILTGTRPENVAHDEFMKTIWSNRAACYIELDQYEKAIIDLSLVLGKERPTSTTGIYPKAYYRLARSFLELGHYEEARRYMNDYVQLKGENAFRDPAVKALHDRIDKTPLPNLSDSPTRPILYLIKILTDGGPNSADLIKHERVPVSLLTANIESDRELFNCYLATTARRYDQEIFDMRPRLCWDCGCRATCLSHTPAAYFANVVPTITSFILPVCRAGGPCDKEAKLFMHETMSSMPM